MERKKTELKRRHDKANVENSVKRKLRNKCCGVSASIQKREKERKSLVKTEELCFMLLHNFHSTNKVHLPFRDTFVAIVAAVTLFCCSLSVSFFFERAFFSGVRLGVPLCWAFIRYTYTRP